MVIIVQRELRTRLREMAADALVREAHVVAAHWTAGVDPLVLARTDGRALGHRVTLILPDGRVVGDTDFDSAGVAGLQNHATRPEVAAAMRDGIGEATRLSPSRGDDELYVAVRTPLGVARVSMPVVTLDQPVLDAQLLVGAAGVAAIVVALVFAWMLAAQLSRPLTELRDVAQRIAAGDYAQRAPISAPGELGELALSLLEQLTESLNEGVIGVDSDRRVVRINETGRALLGVRDALPFPASLIPRDRTLRDALDAAFNGETTEGRETVLNGRTLNVTARPLASGGAVLALLDLTRVRRLESVRRDFVANVSHELRTPITIVSGFAETLVHDDVEPAQRRQFAERMLANTRRMQRIVDDLLDLSRIESGGWVPNPERIDLDVAADEALSAARDGAAAREVELSADIDERARVAFADPTALRQVLGNLVDNAVRHTQRGQVQVFTRPTASDKVEIGVRDTGSGISAEHLPRIFERFYRVDPGRSREEGGTGLGLAIVRVLVEAHGGRVRAESTPGVGTTVTAEFPAADTASGTAGAP
jgi:two-component system phosphate regulon sensor histidine kinase PhoR